MKIDPDFNSDNSAAWKRFRENINPRIRQAMEIAFQDGKVGHRFRPLTAKETRLLQWALELHPAMTFHNSDGAVIGAMLCPCGPCEERACAFTIEVGVELHAQAKGDYSYTRTSDTTVELVKAVRSDHENIEELRTTA